MVHTPQFSNSATVATRRSPAEMRAEDGAMFRILFLRRQLRRSEYLTLADECQQTADLYPTDFIGQEYAELARRWQALAKPGSGEDRPT
jgi:hypothetical protein